MPRVRVTSACCSVRCTAHVAGYDVSSPPQTHVPRRALAKATNWFADGAVSRLQLLACLSLCSCPPEATHGGQARGKREWALPEDFQLRFENEAAELFVGGVYVRLFLRDPRFPLRSPKVRRGVPHVLLGAAHYMCLNAKVVYKVMI